MTPGERIFAAARLRAKGTWVDINRAPALHLKTRWALVRETASVHLMPEQWAELEMLWEATSGLITDTHTT
ncbi:hypothetical protein [Nannocystis pusilla]|uniref:hypothetical protein n=1 Tax=Nannocystis pusilla TaxID=889268 RepID=UPI003DA41820